MKNVRAVIVDDEQDSIDLLAMELARHCPWVEILGRYTNPLKAIDEIVRLQPGLLFLDIEMPVINGFELINRLNGLKTAVIFVTAYNQFALKAFRFNAVDYLVKPVDKNDLVSAVQKATSRPAPGDEELQMLQKNVDGQVPDKIAVPSQNGTLFINLKNILYAEANNNYSKLVLQDGQQFVIAKTLKDIQDVLEETHFLRVHRQYIINLNHVKQLNRNEGLLTMVNGNIIPVGRLQKDLLLKKYLWL